MNTQRALLIVATAIILIQSGFLIVQKMRLDSRNAKIQSFELKVRYWQEVGLLIRNPKAITELESNFNSEVDSVNHQVILTPQNPVDDFYGFLVKRDSCGIVSIVEFKP